MNENEAPAIKGILAGLVIALPLWVIIGMLLWVIME